MTETLRANRIGIESLSSGMYIMENVVEMAITSEMATPSAWGQDVNMTVTILSKAKDKLYLPENQTAKVSTPTVIETSVSHLATLSSSFFYTGTLLPVSMLSFM